MKKKLLLAPLIIALAGCSSIKYTTGFEMSAPTSKADIGSEINYPDWYKETPTKEDREPKEETRNTIQNEIRSPQISS